MSKKNVLITGGSSGIGESLAQVLASTGGYKVIIAGRDEEKLKRVRDTINSVNGEGICHSIRGDTSSEVDVERMHEEAIGIFEGGRIDAIVLNAGVGRFGKCEELTVEDFDLTFNTNVRGVFLWLRKALPPMKSQGYGQIIVTSSNLGVKTSGNCTLYSASKFAVQSMVGCLRSELVGTGVKVMMMTSLPV